MEEIPFRRGHGGNGILGVFGLVVHAHQTGEVSACAHRFVDLVGDFARFVPIADEGLDFVGYPFADFFTEGGVGFVEVGGVELFGRSMLAKLMGMPR